MIKALLYAAVIVFFSLAGRAFGMRALRRAKTLSDISAGIRMLRVHMLDGMLPLGESFERTGSKILARLSPKVTQDGAETAWLAFRNAECVRGGLLDSLETKDINALNTFFGRLGTSVRSVQAATFDAATGELDLLEKSARDGAEQKAGLYTTLGFLAGAAAVVLMI